MLRNRVPGYWAPEMLKKEKYGEEADWWSFGCVLYEFLAGRCPYSKANSGMERDEATLKWDLAFPSRSGRRIWAPSHRARAATTVDRRCREGR